MLFESRYDAIFDVLPARWPPDLLLLGLRLRAAVVSFRATASGLGVFAASAGVGVSADTADNYSGHNAGT
jgi:hypothetical protein